MWICTWVMMGDTILDSIGLLFLENVIGTNTGNFFQSKYFLLNKTNHMTNAYRLEAHPNFL